MKILLGHVMVVVEGRITCLDLPSGSGHPQPTAGVRANRW